MLKIALAQINPCVGDLAANAGKIISAIERAKSGDVDMVIFPELALTGYPPEDLLHQPEFISQNLRALEQVKKSCRGITALVGFVDRRNSRLYNACALIQDGKIQDIYRKIFLPNYGVFDEKRYFASGNSLPIYCLGQHKFSISICEDAWKTEYVRALQGKGLDFVVNISASPFHLGKISQRQQVFSGLAMASRSFVLHCNLVGGQDELVFDGTSMVYSPDGRLIAKAARFAEDTLVWELDKKQKYLTEKIITSSEEEAFFALRLGLRDYVEKNGFKKIVLGVSGGIDSALVLAMAALTLGSKNVHGLIMPSRFSSQATMGDAKKICDNLGVDYSVVGIEPLVKAFRKQLAGHFPKGGADKTEENLQARIRGSLLMAFSNKFGYLVLNTGNKSEVSCGYCTLYGDMVGGFGLLKDLPKDLVYKLSRYINRINRRVIIPASVIKRAPTAELAPGQKDSDTLPPYPVLDPILKLYVEEGLSLDNIVKKGYKRETARKVIRMVDINEYKRRQAPPGVKITPRAFGKDRRMPITNRFIVV